MTVDREDFRRHVERLSRRLCGLYGLRVEPRWDNFVDLTGPGPIVRFYRGDVRDCFVHCRLHLPHGDGKKTEVDLWLYANRLGLSERYRPTSGIEETTDDYRFVGSPFQVLEAVIFLAAECGPLLDGDPEAIAAAVELMRN